MNEAHRAALDELNRLNEARETHLRRVSEGIEKTNSKLRFDFDRSIQHAKSAVRRAAK